MSVKTRLHQFLSKTGSFKTKAQLIEAIKNSQIKIGDQIITNPNYQFKSNKEKVFYRNKEIKTVQNKLYIIINKPENYLSSKLTSEDIQRKKKSVLDLIKVNEKLSDEEKKTLFCVGRLDEDTSGLLLITNDGLLSNQITNPENKIEKSYEVILSETIDERITNSIEPGVTIMMEENGKTYRYRTKPFKINLNKQNKKHLIITISEGKKREIRRIFESINNEVVKLKRISIANIKLDDLKINDKRITEGSYVFVDENWIKERLK